MLRNGSTTPRTRSTASLFCLFADWWKHEGKFREYDIIAYKPETPNG